MNLFLILAMLLITSCEQRIDVSNPLYVQSTPPGGTPGGNPASSPTPLSAGTETGTPGMDGSSPTSPPVVQPFGTQTAVTLTFLPDEDSYVKQSTPDSNYGSETDLLVDIGTEVNQSFIHFIVTDISGPVQNARLRVYAKTNGSLDGPAVYTTDPSWTEDGINWNNRPTHNLDELDNKLEIGSGTWAEYDVTRAVKGNGAVSFALEADSGDGILFASRESGNPPELVITFLSPGAAAPTPTLTAGDVTLSGAGNIASCMNDNDELTAQLLDAIPGVVFTTGNNVDVGGSYNEFMNCYDPTWGRLKDRTNPVPGDNEYQASDSSGYFQYFNNTPPYYAYNLGGWRIYGLNSEIGVEENSKQVIWLKLDLTLNPSKCVLAFWHRPRWSSGATYGNTQRMQTLWKILHDAGAELVINGYEQNYERFMPMDAEGLAEPQGMREFVVGTGGQGLSPFGTPLPSSQVRDASTYGVLKLTLRANSYDWEFVPVPGSTFTDSGSGECH